MGFLYLSNSTNSEAPVQNSFSAKDSTLDRSKHHSKEDEDDDVDIKVKSLIQKMIWDIGLACFNPPIKEKGSSKENSVENYKDKAWLLAESGGSGGELNAAEPRSVHSSFRLSVCTQFELETIKAKNFPSATVLMVNFENGMMDSQPGEPKWKRIESLERSIYPLAHSLIRFTFPEIVSASSNFSTGRVLGRGALSYVFRGKVGILRTAVAIKRLCKEDTESPKVFYRELMIAGSLHNRHIVPLVGFCIDPDEGFFLVYKYVSGGSLDRYLHEKKSGKKGGSTLPCSVRYKVAVQIAEAIWYLHNGTERCIVHRDIKPSNILLSSKKSAKLCDFGLAAWTPAPSVPFLCKTVKGTFGYLAPEYFQHGKVSDKTDVYAFGVVLLELITGRRPIEAKRPGEENLVVWAKPLLEQGCIEKLLDPRLKLSRKNYNRVARMVQTANVCINSEENRRPNAEEISALLRRGGPNCLTKWKASLSRNSSVKDSHPQCQPTKTEMKNHKALAMLGTLDFEDGDSIYCR